MLCFTTYVKINVYCISFTDLRPGDYNCKYDEQCNRSCPFSICVADQTANLTMCRCESGRYEFAHKCCKLFPATCKVQYLNVFVHNSQGKNVQLELEPKEYTVSQQSLKSLT